MSQIQSKIRLQTQLRYRNTQLIANNYPIFCRKSLLSIKSPHRITSANAELDLGHVWGPSDEYLLGKNLAGAVFGIRGNLLKGLQYDAFIGTPIYKPEGFKTSKTALGFQVYYQF